MSSDTYNELKLQAVYIDFIPEQSTGVRNKISYQIEALEDLGVDVIHANYNKGFNFGSSKVISFSSNNKVLRKLSEIKIVYKLLKYDFSNVDFIYLRYIRLTPWFYLFIYFLSKKVDKIFIEIPTYPYDAEVNKYSILTLSDKFFRTKIKRIVDKVFYFGITNDEIWGIPTVKMSNAITTKKIEPIDNIKRKNEKIISFISVSSLAKWHGYDRFIYSLKNSSKDIKDKVLFHVVGDGPERRKLEQLVREFHLESNVIFYGNKQGEQLDDIYNQADIAVGSLGLYRIGLDELTPLKACEYTAKGLPFILANTDPRFEGVNFTFKVSNNSSLLDLKDIIDWYEKISIESKDIRQYAEDNLTWNQQMQKVKDAYIKI